MDNGMSEIICNFELRSKIGCISEAKINRDLFRVSLDLHYLCAVNSAKFFDLKVQSAKEILTLDI